MGGIFGIISPRELPRQRLVEAAKRMMAHGGSGGEDIHTQGPVTFFGGADHA